ncbi:MAG: translation initiation factor IF-3 [Deferribacterales bacterium]
MSDKALENERINEEITAKEVRLVLEDGKQAGIVPIAEALKIAEERGFDLVEVAPNANPPVCRLLDYGKYKFEKMKKEKEARKKQRENMIETKELKLRTKIDEHDYEVKLKQMKKFLEDKNKVKIVVRFKGRETMFGEHGIELLNRIVADLADLCVVDKKPEMQGRQQVMIIAPKN